MLHLHVRAHVWSARAANERACVRSRASRAELADRGQPGISQRLLTWVYDVTVVSGVQTCFFVGVQQIKQSHGSKSISHLYLQYIQLQDFSPYTTCVY